MPTSRTLLAAMLVLPWLMSGQTPEEGIPVTDPLVIAKCGSCHTRDERGNMLRISWERATPEGWEEALKRMIRFENVNLTPPEARSIIKYLSSGHGLAPEEAKPMMYLAERRIQDEASLANDSVRGSCAGCHLVGRILSWRRSLSDWKKVVNQHLALYPQAEDAIFGNSAGEEAIAFLGKTAPLHSPEWEAWRANKGAAKLAGRWLVSAHIQGRGKYYGEMEVEQSGAEDEFATRVTLQSVSDGSTIRRSGHGLIFGGYAWRGRSKGIDAAGSAPDDLSSEVREAMWFAPDQSQAEGRWFWGPYQEFGFDVHLRRATSNPALIAVDRSSLKTGSRANRIRLIGDNIPAEVALADLDLGAGVTVRRIVSSTASEIIAEVDVASDAMPGKRDAAFRHSVVQSALAIYDRVDYIKVVPESAIAQFGGQAQAKGYQQFEAIGYQRGPDGIPHSADDVDLGPIEVTWSVEPLYWVPDGKDLFGALSPTGFFTPASEGPQKNTDAWVIATAKTEKGSDGKPLVGKGYLVVSVPAYMFHGRRYVRDLDRWVEDENNPR